MRKVLKLNNAPTKYNQSNILRHCAVAKNRQQYIIDI